MKNRNLLKEEQEMFIENIASLYMKMAYVLSKEDWIKL